MTKLVNKLKKLTISNAIQYLMIGIVIFSIIGLVFPNMAYFCCKPVYIAVIAVSVLLIVDMTKGKVKPTV